REQLTREVTRNKKQLDKTTKIISQNGEILEKLEKELEALKSGNHNKEQSISNLETIIHQNLKIGENWDDFAHYFNLVYADFFERLKADYENLTQSELRLCALQVLNLGDKEISKVLYVSPDSIKKARYRLRKKLELPEGKTLKDVLRQYYKSVEV
ncbi:MAG: hypothetical protein MRY83_16955, partial [Flavobacteriales bacterium]|nr:hypothetical protein [Flavobacteriales bacterium]